MDDLDRRLLDIIQTDFPLVPRPYAELGKRLDVSEECAFERVCALRDQGVIRQLSANFRADKLGYVSTLCGAKVPEEKLDEFIERVNALPGVTHNYLRKNVFNVWFTLICPSREEAARVLEELGQTTGVHILNLPATELYKVAVNFKMQRGAS
ncbi:MAG: AsnC family transcriptional regulator [Desulfovibrio sp.]|nr:AsnC family transcriptional regulator [Desulfovibrio sp.]